MCAKSPIHSTKKSKCVFLILPGADTSYRIRRGNPGYDKDSSEKCVVGEYPLLLTYKKGNALPSLS
jgi:hypothetical protein